MAITWGTFGAVHLISLLLAILLNVGLYFLLKGRSRRTQIVTLGILSFAGIAAILYNLLMWGTPLEYLPFHLCSLSALLLPIAVLTRKRIPCNLLLLWSLGAFVALILNYSVAEAEVLSWTFFFYYFPHALECGIPILLFKLGLCKLSPRCILPTVGITLLAYTLIHFLNVGINRYCLEQGILNPAGELVQVNYMFSITPENPLLALFYQWIPHPYWYMIPVIAVVALYLGAIYGVQALLKRRKQK